MTPRPVVSSHSSRPRDHIVPHILAGAFLSQGRIVASIVPTDGLFVMSFLRKSAQMYMVGKMRNGRRSKNAASVQDAQRETETIISKKGGA